MENIAYLMGKSNSDFFKIMKLPYAVFLSLLKHFRIIDINSTPEGRELLAKSKRLYATEPELNKLRELNAELNSPKLIKD